MNQVLNKTDIAVVVIDGTCGVSEEDLKITEQIQKKNIPYIIVLNKCEQFTQEDERLRVQENTASYLKTEKEKILLVSAADKSGIYELKEELGALKGNTNGGSGEVARHQYPVGYYEIYGYCTPAYPRLENSNKN